MSIEEHPISTRIIAGLNPVMGFLIKILYIFTVFWIRIEIEALIKSGFIMTDKRREYK